MSQTLFFSPGGHHGTADSKHTPTHTIKATGTPSLLFGPSASYVTLLPPPAAPIASAFFSVASILSLGTSMSRALRSRVARRAFMSVDVECEG